MPPRITSAICLHDSRSYLRCASASARSYRALVTLTTRRYSSGIRLSMRLRVREGKHRGKGVQPFRSLDRLRLIMKLGKGALQLRDPATPGSSRARYARAPERRASLLAIRARQGPSALDIALHFRSFRRCTRWRRVFACSRLSRQRPPPSPGLSRCGVRRSIEQRFPFRTGTPIVWYISARKKPAVVGGELCALIEPSRSGTPRGSCFFGRREADTPRHPG